MTSSSDKSGIAEKIRALLAKTPANGASEEEAATALSMAAALMAKHNLSRAQVEVGAREFNSECVHEAQGVPLNWTFAIPVVEACCQVHCIMRTELDPRLFPGSACRFEIFGDGANVESATTLLKYLAGVFKDLWIRHRIWTWGAPEDEAGYYEGLRAGLLVRLENEKREREVVSTGRELVLASERLRAAFNEEYGETEDFKVLANQDTFAAGARDSSLINLKRELEQE